MPRTIHLGAPALGALLFATLGAAAPRAADAACAQPLAALPAPSGPLPSPDLLEESFLGKIYDDLPEVFDEYVRELDAFYAARCTTLAQRLKQAHPALFDGAEVLLEEDEIDLHDTATLLEHLVETRPDVLGYWQLRDTSLREAKLGALDFLRIRRAADYAFLLSEWAPLASGKRHSDFDGDPLADEAVFRPTTGDWLIRLSADGTTRTLRLGGTAQGDLPVPADYDGDGTTDPGLWRPSTGMWTILESSTGQTRTRQWGSGAEGDLPVPNDYDGDGRMDLAVWRASTGQWFHVRSSDGASVGPPFGSGAQGDAPIVGDFDGDGRADLAVRRAATGVTSVRQSADGLVVTLGDSGQSGDFVAPGDYDGDERTDLGIWGPNFSAFRIRHTGGAVTVLPWSSRGPNTAQAPLASDFDGDGRADFGLFSGGGGPGAAAVWTIFGSRDSARVDRSFGVSGDVPLSSVYFR
jgi:hypothetical protein